MKKTMFAFLGMLCLAMPLAVHAQYYTSPWFYSINASNSNTITVTGYSGSATTLSIPSAINGLTVTCVGNGETSLFASSSLNGITIPMGVITLAPYAFADCSWHVTSVTIPASVTSIGDFAFNGCANLNNLTIPVNVTNIGQYAFQASGLTTVNIPASVTKFGEGAFAGGDLLTITVDASNPDFSSLSGVLFDKNQLTVMEYPGSAMGGYTIPNTVTNIGPAAFADCYWISSVKIPSTVNTIGADAFFDCFALTNAAISNGVVNIGANAFEGSGLTNVTIPASVSTIGEAPFQACQNMKAIAVDPNNAYYSALNGALFNQNQTTLIQYPGGVAGSYTIPASVTGVQNNAFSSCLTLTGVTIPATVASIGGQTFEYCDALAAITVTSGNPDFSSVNGILFNKNQTTILQYPQRAPSATYAIPGTVNTIGDNAFCDNYILTSVTIPSGVTSIGQNAFLNCSALTTVAMPDSITHIGQFAFSYTSVTNITIPSGCTNVGSAAFANSALTSLIIPSSVTTIGSNAFSDTPLTTLTIPASVISIGQEAFAYCNSLTNVYFNGNAPIADSSVFYDSDGALANYVPGTSGWAQAIGGIPTAGWYLPYPVILVGVPSFGVQGQNFGFTISWATNGSVVVEITTNLSCQTWTPIQTNTLNNGTWYFSEPLQTSPSRFYRVRSH